MGELERVSYRVSVEDLTCLVRMLSVQLIDLLFGEVAHADRFRFDVERAWKVSTGDAPITIAFIGKGIDKDHPDLSATRWTNPNDSIDGQDNDHDDSWYGQELVDDYWVGISAPSPHLATTNPLR